ncbi:MAG: substrate-binding domain-containing protein [Pseudomonadota bacterium]
MKKVLAVCAFFAAAVVFSTAAEAREIRIVGSSTVFPFSTTVAEQFGANTRFSTPIVEATGSGSGIKLFCSGVGRAHPDIANASRRMKGSEYDLCQANNVSDIVEVKIGYDGIVLANTKKSERFSVSKAQIFMALAKEVPMGGRLVENPYERWSDIAADLPDLPIQVFGPPPSSGTRDAFVELAMEGGAMEMPMLAEIAEEDENLFREIAHSLREDGRWIDAGENDGAIVQTLTKNPDALGVFGYSFLAQNGDRLQGAIVGGVDPSFENIAGGEYRVSRSLYFYLKKAHAGVVEGLPEFIEEFTSEDAWGEDGYLIEKGLIPLPQEARFSMAETSRGMQPMTARP